MSALEAAAAVDAIYRMAIESPESIDDAFLAEWLEDSYAIVEHDRMQAKPLRAAMRNAQKFALRFATTPVTLPDWRNGVDEALGARGWQPQLDLLRNEFGVNPTPEVFEAIKERHRAVYFNEWMEGVSFEEWAADSGQD